MAPRWCIWLRRILYCRGFGIQSPADYWFVRYVINEHWHYYQYDTIGQDDNWLTRKLGRLYFRLANWRQPAVVVDETASPYWQAGCHKTVVKPHHDGHIELMLLRNGLPESRQKALQAIAAADDSSVVVVEHLWRDKQLWNNMVSNQRVTVAFDLYYCGILFFDRKRTKCCYTINF